MTVQLVILQLGNIYVYMYIYISDAGFTRALNILQPYKQGDTVYIYCCSYVVLNVEDVVEFISNIQTLFDLWVARKPEPTQPPPYSSTNRGSPK